VSTDTKTPAVRGHELSRTNAAGALRRPGPSPRWPRAWWPSRAGNTAYPCASSAGRSMCTAAPDGSRFMPASTGSQPSRGKPHAAFWLIRPITKAPMTAVSQAQRRQADCDGAVGRKHFCDPHDGNPIRVRRQRRPHRRHPVRDRVRQKGRAGSRHLYRHHLYRGRHCGGIRGRRLGSPVFYTQGAPSGGPLFC
jgi:hypothetical protein